VPWTDVKVRRRFQVPRLRSEAPAWRAGFRCLRKTVVECLLKEVTFRNTLFPAEILSNGQELLARPVGLRVTHGGQEKLLTTGRFRITSQDRRQACWETTAEDSNVTVRVNGRIEFDGFTWMDITLLRSESFGGQALASGTVDRVAIEIPLRKECATLRTIGGTDLPDTERGYWFGNEKAGLQYCWQSNKGWVLGNEGGKIVETNGEMVLSIPFIQKTTDLAKARTIALGGRSRRRSPYARIGAM